MKSVHIFKKIINLKCLIALSAVLISYQTLLVFNVNNYATVCLFGFIFCSTLAVYNTGHVHLIGHERFFIRLTHSNSDRKLVWKVASVGALLFLWFLPHQTQVIAAVAGITTAWYVMPVSIKQSKLHGLRKIFLLKNIWLAMGWAIVTVLIPLSTAAVDLTEKSVYLIFLSRMFIVFSISLVFDIRDMDVDRQNRHATLPVVWSVLFTKIIALIATLFFAILIYHRFYHHTALMKYAPAMVTSTLLLMVLIIAAPTGKNFWFYEVTMDAMLAVQALLMISCLVFL